MKKINYFVALLFVACLFGSCAFGTYVPHALNLIGTQTTVVLDKANFRVVRNVEAVVEVDNDRLRRADVEKSAFAELTRRYPLTGSQAYVNVVFEEVQREKVFAFHYGRYALKQYVAVRATIIEFLQDNGEPVKSVESPYNTAAQRATKTEAQKADAEQIVAQPEEELTLQKLAKLDKNKYYIMFLFKSSNFDNSKMSEAEKYFDIKSLQNQKVKFSYKELQKLSANHDKVFEKFARN